MATKQIDICDACGASEERVQTDFMSSCPVPSVISAHAVSDYIDAPMPVARGGIRLGYDTFDLCPACSDKAAAAVGLSFMAKAQERADHRRAVFRGIGPTRAPIVVGGTGALTTEELIALGIVPGAPATDHTDPNHIMMTIDDLTSNKEEP